MNVLLFRHGRNYYMDHSNPDKHGQLNPAGRAFAAAIPKFADVVAVKGHIDRIYAWFDDNEYDRCVGTVAPLAAELGLKVQHFADAARAAEIGRALKQEASPGWAVMCVRSQDCKNLRDIFPRCDEHLDGYEKFVIYRQLRPGEGEYEIRQTLMGHEIYDTPKAQKYAKINQAYKSNPAAARSIP